MTVHLIKIAAGVAHLDELQARLHSYSFMDEIHGEITPVPTRNKPKRDAELKGGGSIYWIIKGKVAARTAIVDIVKEETDDGRPLCRLCVKSELIPVIPIPRRGFQGWRYYNVSDAPEDMPHGLSQDDGASGEMAAELKELGLI